MIFSITIFWNLSNFWTLSYFDNFLFINFELYSLTFIRLFFLYGGPYTPLSDSLLTPLYVLSWVNGTVRDRVSNNFLSFFLLPHMHFLDTLNEIIFCFSKADWCFKAILFRIARIKIITCTLSHSDEQYFAVSSPPHTVQSSNEEVFAELVFVPQQGALL